VLLVDHEGRVLLFRGEARRVFWFPPGGEIEPGEDPRAAAVREVREETGLELDDPGCHVFNREHVFEFSGMPTRLVETWFFARCAPFEVDVSGFTDFEREQGLIPRWWTLEELEAATDYLVPRDLAARVRSLLADGPPATPLELGV
jgi:8-oxo-dGTP pyrophosphatase MutT (NUDIX family)